MKFFGKISEKFQNIFQSTLFTKKTWHRRTRALGTVLLQYSSLAAPAPRYRDAVPSDKTGPRLFFVHSFEFFL